jgi:hypothetical protein
MNWLSFTMKRRLLAVEIVSSVIVSKRLSAFLTQKLKIKDSKVAIKESSETDRPELSKVGTGELVFLDSERNLTIVIYLQLFQSGTSIKSIGQFPYSLTGCKPAKTAANPSGILY